MGNGAVTNPMEVSSPRTEKESSPSQSSSSDKVDGDDLQDLNVEQTHVLLFKTEAKARITALRQKQSTPPSLSAGSVQHLQQRNSVSAVLPEEPTGVALSTLSIAENEPSSASRVNDVGIPTEQDAGKTKESFASIPSHVLLSLPSMTQPNPSLESSSYRDAVTPPLYRYVPAVTVSAADLRGVPRLTSEPNQNVPEISRRFRIIV